MLLVVATKYFPLFSNDIVLEFYNLFETLLLFNSSFTKILRSIICNAFSNPIETLKNDLSMFIYLLRNCKVFSLTLKMHIKKNRDKKLADSKEFLVSNPHGI